MQQMRQNWDKLSWNKKWEKEIKWIRKPNINTNNTKNCQKIFVFASQSVSIIKIYFTVIQSFDLHH